MNGTIVGDGIPESYTAVVVEPNAGEHRIMTLQSNGVDVAYYSKNLAEVEMLKNIRQFVIEDVDAKWGENA